jgi:hypothetical protein
MNQALTILPVLLLLFILGGTVFFSIRSYRTRQDIREFFSTGECHGKGLLAVTAAVSAANARSRDYTFGVDRAVRILFRGHLVWIVLGSVGSTVPSKWSGIRNF